MRRCCCFAGIQTVADVRAWGGIHRDPDDQPVDHEAGHHCDQLLAGGEEQLTAVKSSSSAVLGRMCSPDRHKCRRRLRAQEGGDHVPDEARVLDEQEVAGIGYDR